MPAHRLAPMASTVTILFIIVSLMKQRAILLHGTRLKHEEPRGDSIHSPERRRNVCFLTQW